VTSGSFKLVGDLTIRGVTREQVLEAGGLAVSDVIKFSVDVALIRPAG